MKLKITNCDKCIKFINKKCDKNMENCICKKCPRNIEKCILTKYCSETESILDI
ncbi:hypothetical protein [Clostridium oceanicum]|uniref:Alpha/beta hydrolase n=1 Tax=Clostridium oceanicum TaxID=1543 RepID=A0ABP3UNJ5_9CLOT